MKKNFHLMYAIPPHRHQLLGANDFIESVQWGLEQLGHDVSVAINSFYPDRRNIIFGAQILPIDFMRQLPNDTIIYNLEQMHGITGDYIRPEMQFYAQHFDIWDYKKDNLASWATLENVRKVKVVPVAYAPILTRIPKPPYQDIDVLIYGLPNDVRLDIFNQLANVGLTVVFACGLYGESRDNFIARAKLIVNVSLFQQCQQFEIVRVSYLLANKKAVVSVLNDETVIEENDLTTGIKFSSMDNLISDCLQLVDDEKLRTELENAGFEAFSQRDIRTVLQTALAS